MKTACLGVMAITGLLAVAAAGRAETKSGLVPVQGMKKVQSLVVDLSREGQPKLRLKRGQCYKLHIRPEEGARWPSGHVRFRFRSARRDPWTTSIGRTVKGKEILVDMGCFPDTSAYTFRMELADPDGTRGAGTATAKLYARKARPGELERTVNGPDPEEIARREEREKREYCARCREENFNDQDGLETCAAIRYDRRTCYSY